MQLAGSKQGSMSPTKTPALGMTGLAQAVATLLTNTKQQIPNDPFTSEDYDAAERFCKLKHKTHQEKQVRLSF